MILSLFFKKYLKIIYQGVFFLNKIKYEKSIKHFLRRLANCSNSRCKAHECKTCDLSSAVSRVQHSVYYTVGTG